MDSEVLPFGDRRVDEAVRFLHGRLVRCGPRGLSVRSVGGTERQKNPHPPGSLAFAAWVCARLGGWTGYYGKPGPVVMLKGLYEFRAIQLGYNLALATAGNV